MCLGLQHCRDSYGFGLCVRVRKECAGYSSCQSRKRGGWEIVIMNVGLSNFSNYLCEIIFFHICISQMMYLRKRTSSNWFLTFFVPIMHLLI